MRRLHIAPLIGLGLAAAFSTILVLSVALTRPWVGLTLVAADDAVIVTDWAAARDDALQGGDQVLALQQGDLSIPITPADRIEEPDGLPTTTDMKALFARSGQMDQMLQSGEADLLIQRGAAQVAIPATLAQNRPVADLPLVFWVQIFVGVTSMLVGGWVMALRPNEVASRWLALAGVGLMAASHAAAMYSTRELALPEGVFAWGSALNSAGALSFGLGMMCLFLTYPVRYLPKWLIWGISLFFGAWIVLSFFRFSDAPAMLIHIPTLVLMIGILLGAAGQVWATRGNPSARAAMRWFGLSVTIGAGSFVALIALPQAMGFSPQISQGYAFALFLIVYAGLAAGVARYKLFELEFWAFRALFYAGGVALLLILDALLIYTVAIDRIPAFSIALLVVAFVYLPARDYLSQLFTGRKSITTTELFDLVSNAALAPGAAAQEQAMRRLLDQLFHPLSIESAPEPVSHATLLKNGEAMDVPGIEGSPDLRMYWAHRGRRLFSTRDLHTVQAVIQMSAQVVERRRAYAAGAEEERHRINRDMHDHIGAQLLGALHSGSDDRKNALIRQTLTDLREIVSNPGGDPFPLHTLLGDLRAELSEHLSSVDVALNWTEGDLPDVDAAPIVVSSIRAILREGTSNILRHSGATTAWVDVTTDRTGGQEWLNITIGDDGRGLATQTAMVDPHSGNGLRNLTTRLNARGGRFSAETGPEGKGTVLTARLPLLVATPKVMALKEAGE
ncbi:sensor histidine kinase [Pseudooceanicola sp. MF1-13]|uniref:sensor histidine kinase n=1 Tax=Pseudooceanicola sp. MF1-13 TaxID=3379095 RepID=UPI00389263EA